MPLGLTTLLLDAFRCSICKGSPITPPVIFARCCKSIVGCQHCIDHWYRGDQGVSKKCPLCRGDRGFADTTIILGLDDLLIGVNSLCSSNNLNVPAPPREIPNFEDV